MQAAIEIDFQGMAADEALRQLITKHIATLDERFGEITWCRVAIKAPSEHHHKGGLYEITLHIILPHGRAVDIDRTATADERYADPAFAVNDAFKRALRRLVERTRRQRGKVKAHDGQNVNGSDLSSLEPPEGRQDSRPEASEAATVNQSGKPA